MSPGMLCSFEDAVQSTLLGLGTGRGHPQGVIRAADRASLSHWAEVWRHVVQRRFLTSYLTYPDITPLLPKTQQDIERLLYVLTLERWVNEFTSEMRLRPHWLTIPMSGILRLIKV
jgi:maltose alpha-D-glucosyltransferase / alpha-amylase